MTGIALDPSRASESLLEALPAAARAHLEAKLALPASRRDMLDLASANSQLFILISSVLVALKTGNSAALEPRMETLLDQLEAFSDLTRRITTRLLVADEEGLVGAEDDNG